MLRPEVRSLPLPPPLPQCHPHRDLEGRRSNFRNCCRPSADNRPCRSLGGCSRACGVHFDRLASMVCQRLALCHSPAACSSTCLTRSTGGTPRRAPAGGRRPIPCQSRADRSRDTFRPGWTILCTAVRVGSAAGNGGEWADDAMVDGHCAVAGHGAVAGHVGLPPMAASQSGEEDGAPGPALLRPPLQPVQP